MGDRGVLLSAVVPNPLPEAERLIELQSRMKRSPDAYLIMPLGGVYSMEGFVDTFLSFGERVGQENDALYHRQPRDRKHVVQLVTRNLPCLSA